MKFLPIITKFLGDIGIKLKYKEGVNGFLKDVTINKTTVLFCNVTERTIGDILHEAGHISVIPSKFRKYLKGDIRTAEKAMHEYLNKNPLGLAKIPECHISRGILQSGEVEAIAWSYAAAVHLGIDPIEVFKYSGLEGLEINLKANSYFGINGLVAGGMTDHPRSKTAYSFPKMKRWMQV